MAVKMYGVFQSRSQGPLSSSLARILIVTNKAQTKAVKVAVFRKVSFKPALSHISLNKGNIAVTAANLATWRRSSTSCHRLRRKTLRRKGLLSQRENTHQLCLERESSNPERSNGSRNGACALILPLSSLCGRS
ncbi:unnamed protein product [Pocillopora meandrina]|uniref:Uncharacterized protein n=1 Tax=Pocillopora meandrina TaxID=46732 RepID=A0AAU9X2D9_9CNID|nr:unnamed protein product [Pocillopora meandrina]